MGAHTQTPLSLRMVSKGCGQRLVPYCSSDVHKMSSHFSFTFLVQFSHVNALKRFMRYNLTQPSDEFTVANNSMHTSSL